MPFNRTSSCVAIGLLLCFCWQRRVSAKGRLGFQIFAPADVSTFGGEQEPNEGYFFQFDGLYWSISAPEVVPIGFPGTRTRLLRSPDDDRSDQRRADSDRTRSDTCDHRQPVQRRQPDRVWPGRGPQRLVREHLPAARPNPGLPCRRRPTWSSTIRRSDLTERPLLYGNVNNNNTTTPPYTPPVFRNLPVTFSNVFVENAIDTWGVEAELPAPVHDLPRRRNVRVVSGRPLLRIQRQFPSPHGRRTTERANGSFLPGRKFLGHRRRRTTWSARRSGCGGSRSKAGGCSPPKGASWPA